MGVNTQYMLRQCCRFIAMLIVVCTASIVKAGHYVVTYSTSGTFSLTGGAPTSKSYNPSTGAFNGTATFAGEWYIQNPGGTFKTNNGTITAQAIWTKDDPSDISLPPPNVIVEEHVSVNLTTAYVVGPGTITDDLGHTATAPSQGLWESLSLSNSVYTSQAGTSSITKSRTPTINVGTVHWAASSSSCNATVTFTLTIHRVDIVLTGGANVANDILIGQNLGAYVTVDGVSTGDQDTFSWTVSGCDPFQEYKVNVFNGEPDSATVIPFTPQNYASMSTYLRTPGQYTVTCVFRSHLLNQAITVTRMGNAFAPNKTWGAYMVSPNFISSQASPSRVSLLQLNSGLPTTSGIIYTGSVTTPQLFASQGPSWWCHLQLIVPNRAADSWRPSDPDYSPVNGTQVLDTSFPYNTPDTVLYDSSHTYEAPANGYVINPGGTETMPAFPYGSLWSDSPSQTLYNSPNANHTVTASDSFTSVMLYYPPKTAQYVPLKSMGWYWSAVGHINSGNPQWTWDARQSAWGFLSDFPPHPTWTHRGDTSHWPSL